MTVYAVNMPNIDTSTALKFGDIHHINTRYVYPDELEGADNQLPIPVRVKFMDAVSKFDPDSDYVLIAGDHLQLVYFMALLGAAHHGYPIRVLRWDRQIEGYGAITLHIPTVEPTVVTPSEPPAIEPHPCPFQRDVHNNSETLCTCDKKKTQECTDDI